MLCKKRFHSFLRHWKESPVRINGSRIIFGWQTVRIVLRKNNRSGWIMWLHSSRNVWDVATVARRALPRKKSVSQIWAERSRLVSPGIRHCRLFIPRGAPTIKVARFATIYSFRGLRSIFYLVYNGLRDPFHT